MHTLTALVASLPSDTIGPATETVKAGVLLVAPLLVGIPLLSAAVLLLLGRRTDRWGHWLGVLASSAAFVVGAIVFVKMLAAARGVARARREPGHTGSTRARSTWTPGCGSTRCR